MFDLNGEDFAEREIKGIFNAGVAGKTDNIIIKEVYKKKMEDREGSPDFKIIFADTDNQEINIGFWKKSSNEKLDISRALHVARAIVGKDYKFPAANDYKDALEKLMKIIAKESKDKLFNLYTNYGTEKYPKKFLTVRYFDFIEAADFDGNSKLFKKKDDLLENIVSDDKPKASSNEDDTNEDDNDDWLN